MIKAVLTDIEGTTSSIQFVHKVLFPYAREALGSFIRESQDPEVQYLVNKLWVERLEGETGSKPDFAKVTELLQDWIDNDLKEPILKALQGKVWRAGYEAKAYLGHVYPEVKEVFMIWKQLGLKIAIYSSGSVEAQKLIFGYSESGDLTPLLDSYFDTSVGTKREPKSYEAIREALELPAEEILFLSDIKEELDAARAIGMRTIQLLRDPRPSLGDHDTAETFADVHHLIIKN